jgi:homoserine dehydrogenase
VLVTHATPESKLLDAISRIEKLETVLERPRLLRVARI